jgi:hypothetical protein
MKGVMHKFLGADVYGCQMSPHIKYQYCRNQGFEL